MGRVVGFVIGRFPRGLQVRRRTTSLSSAAADASAKTYKNWLNWLRDKYGTRPHCSAFEVLQGAGWKFLTRVRGTGSIVSEQLWKREKFFHRNAPRFSNNETLCSKPETYFGFKQKVIKVKSTNSPKSDEAVFKIDCCILYNLHRFELSKRKTTTSFYRRTYEIKGNNIFSGIKFYYFMTTLARIYTILNSMQHLI